MSKIILFFSLSLMGAWAGEIYPCAALLAEKAVAQENPTQRFFYWEQERQGAYLTAKLKDDGTLVFSIRTRDSLGQPLSEVRATDLFDQMMQHFKGRVKKIAAVWTVDIDEEKNKFAFTLSSNLQQYNAARAAGWNDNRAIFSTWTGQQALRYGFRSISDVKKNMIGDLALSVNVIFVKKSLWPQ